MSLPFVGRIQEIEIIKDLYQKKTASLVVLKGRRRIGKSRFLEEVGRDCRFIRLTGLPPNSQTTAQSERDEFASQLARVLQLPPLKASDWTDLFLFLDRETREEVARGREKKKVMIVFDEISWMGSKDPNFLCKFKTAWDENFKQNSSLVFVLCGSISAWIEDNILKNTGFVGRLSLVLTLKELSLKDSVLLLKAVGFQGPPMEILKVLAVTGGVPRYLEEIRGDRLAEENIRALCFKEEGVLFREFQEIFVDIFSRRCDLYQAIVSVLSEGDLELSEISERSKLSKNGRLSEYLEDLIASGFVQRDFTWNLKNGEPSLLSHYRLSDNYLRFYLKYIEKNRLKIANQYFKNRSIQTLPGWESIMGLQFENLVLNNRALLWEKLHIQPEDIVSDNPYFQRPQVRKQGCQVDYLIQVRSNVLYVCEIKFSKNPLGLNIIQELKNKIEKLSLPRGYAAVPVLIHVGGVLDSVLESEYFIKIIDYAEFLN